MQIWTMTLYLLLIFCCFFVLDAKSNNYADRITGRKRATCESVDCGHIYFMEATNCVNQCVSRNCYNEVYGSGKELEDGEINQNLDRTFKNCVRREVMKNKRQKA